MAQRSRAFEKGFYRKPPRRHRHDEVPERDQRAVVAAVGLGEQGRQFLVGVDVRDVTGRPRERAGGQDVGRHAAAAQPTGQLPHRRGQSLQGRRNSWFTTTTLGAVTLSFSVNVRPRNRGIPAV